MNYVKTSRKFICNMAMSLAMVLATFLASALVACSDDKPVSGGASEETKGFASLEDITIKGRARMAVSSNENEGLKQIIVVGLEKGTQVSLYELDPKSFEKTGKVFSEVVDSDDGSFAFENVTLASPYVLITALRPGSASVYAYSAFVDVRDADEINIDILTHLEALRALYLAESGTAFENAKERARKEALEAFGMYDVPDNIRETDELEYKAIIAALSDVLPVSIYSIYPISMPWENSNLNKLFEALAEQGSFVGVDAAMEDAFVGTVNSCINTLRASLIVPIEAYEMVGEKWVEDYRVDLAMAKYLTGMLSVVYGAGRCDTEGEGKVFEYPGTMELSEYPAYGLVCRSGAWHLADNDIEHSEGLMTDARDGKTYKTVTIDLGGSTQTWMAENLRFDGTGATDSALIVNLEGNVSCDETWSFIEGCYYSSTAMLNLDSSCFIYKYAYESLDACKKEWQESGSIPYGGIDAFCESTMADPWIQFDLEKVDVSDSAKYQGVCPDGWRLPAPRDWERLLTTIRTHYDLPWGGEAIYLYDIPIFGNPVGFGLSARYSIMQMANSPVIANIYGTDLGFAPGYLSYQEDEYGQPLPSMVVNTLYIYSWREEFVESLGKYPVRCIKDE